MQWLNLMFVMDFLLWIFNSGFMMQFAVKMSMESTLHVTDMRAPRKRLVTQAVVHLYA